MNLKEYEIKVTSQTISDGTIIRQLKELGVTTEITSNGIRWKRNK